MFLGMGRPAWREARATLQKILSGSLFFFCSFYLPTLPFRLFLY